MSRSRRKKPFMGMTTAKSASDRTPPSEDKGLRPCPFCNEVPETDGDGYVCHVPEHDEACNFDNPSTENWNSAHCWKLLDEARADYNRVMDLNCRFDEELGKAMKEIEEKDVEIGSLTRLLATERDRFGKRETELMARITRLEAALKRVYVEISDALPRDLEHDRRLGEAYEMIQEALGERPEKDIK